MKIPIRDEWYRTRKTIFHHFDYINISKIFHFHPHLDMENRLRMLKNPLMCAPLWRLHNILSPEQKKSYESAGEKKSLSNENKWHCKAAKDLNGENVYGKNYVHHLREGFCYQNGKSFAFPYNDYWKQFIDFTLATISKLAQLLTDNELCLPANAWFFLVIKNFLYHQMI